MKVTRMNKLFAVSGIIILAISLSLRHWITDPLLAETVRNVLLGIMVALTIGALIFWEKTKFPINYKWICYLLLAGILLYIGLKWLNSYIYPPPF